MGMLTAYRFRSRARFRAATRSYGLSLQGRPVESNRCDALDQCINFLVRKTAMVGFGITAKTVVRGQATEGRLPDSHGSFS